MFEIGINDEGVPDYPLKKLDNGYVVPDVSVEDIHKYHRQQVDQQIERAVTAEKHGYDYVLHPEHHFAFLGATSPNPLFTQLAVAERTEDISLLQMANILPWHEPVRLAEQIAMLDIVSDGRTEVGIGRGFGSREGATLGQYWGGTPDYETQNHQSFREKYDILIQSWTQNFVSHHGHFHDVPPSYTRWENDQEYHYLANVAEEYEPDAYMNAELGTTTLRSLPVFPQPHQQPHPQIWKPVTSPESADWAARQGINGCTHCTTFDDVAELVDAYHDAAEVAEWPDHRPEYDGEPFRRGWDANRHRGIAVILSVFNTELADDEAFERWKLGQEHGLSRKKSSLPAEKAAKIDIDAEELLQKMDSPIVGDTEEIIDQLAVFRDTCGYDDFIVIVQTKVPGMGHEESIKQFEAFANDVAPYFEE